MEMQPFVVRESTQACKSCCICLGDKGKEVKSSAFKPIVSKNVEISEEEVTKGGEESSDGKGSNKGAVSSSQAKDGKEESTKEGDDTTSGRTVSAKNVTFLNYSFYSLEHEYFKVDEIGDDEYCH